MENIGKYAVIKELGRGATSTVYLAHDPVADRQVAIKLLNTGSMDDAEAAQFRKLFLTEASLAGKIEHPYIAAIHDAVIGNDASYLVMEYVGGGTLERYCQVDNLLPVDKVLEIAFKCCRALNYASGKGIIHRDIKPENILVADGTDIKISDFGAAAISADHDGAEELSGVGSLAYMSPQRIENQELTQQADIYSLGVMMYIMLTGSLPFTATDDAGLTFQILHIEPQPPSTYRMDLPMLIDSLVMRSMAKSLDDRYRSWDEFERALMSVFDELPRAVSSFPDTEKFSSLRKLDFFRDFGELELWEVLRISNWAYYPEGTSIIREGDETVSFFIIISGQVEVRKNGRGVCTIGEGECFGEMSGIRRTERRRTASIVAHTDIKLIEVNEQLLHQSSDACQRRFDKAFLGILADRLAAAGAQDKSRDRARKQAQTTQSQTPPAPQAVNQQAHQPAAQAPSATARTERPPIGMSLLRPRFAMLVLVGLAALFALRHYAM